MDTALEASGSHWRPLGCREVTSREVWSSFTWGLGMMKQEWRNSSDPLSRAQVAWPLGRHPSARVTGTVAGCSGTAQGGSHVSHHQFLDHTHTCLESSPQQALLGTFLNESQVSCPEKRSSSHAASPVGCPCPGISCPVEGGRKTHIIATWMPETSVHVTLAALLRGRCSSTHFPAETSLMTQVCSGSTAHASPMTPEFLCPQSCQNFPGASTLRSCLSVNGTYFTTGSLSDAATQLWGPWPQLATPSGLSLAVDAGPTGLPWLPHCSGSPQDSLCV